jgi:hypothetical protein
MVFVRIVVFQVSLRIKVANRMWPYVITDILKGFNTFHLRRVYIYCVASHASCPGSVFMLCDFHKVVKWANTGILNGCRTQTVNLIAAFILRFMNYAAWLWPWRLRYILGHISPDRASVWTESTQENRTFMVDCCFCCKICFLPHNLNIVWALGAHSMGVVW